MKIASIVLLFLASCGADECADYVKTYCNKIALCDSGAYTPNCEQLTLSGVHAAHDTPEQCHAANEKIAPMGCASFNAFLQSLVTSR